MTATVAKPMTDGLDSPSAQGSRRSILASMGSPKKRSIDSKSRGDSAPVNGDAPPRLSLNFDGDDGKEDIENGDDGKEDIQNVEDHLDNGGDAGEDDPELGRSMGQTDSLLRSRSQTNKVGSLRKNSRISPDAATPRSPSSNAIINGGYGTVGRSQGARNNVGAMPTTPRRQRTSSTPIVAATNGTASAAKKPSEPVSDGSDYDDDHDDEDDNDDDPEPSRSMGQTDSLLRSRGKDKKNKKFISLRNLRKASDDAAAAPASPATPVSPAPPASPAPAAAPATPTTPTTNGGYGTIGRSQGARNNVGATPITPRRQRMDSTPIAAAKNDTAAAPKESSAPVSNGSNGAGVGRLRRRFSNLSTTSKNSKNEGKNDDDADRASQYSNLSSNRDAISAFIRRSRSRSSSAEPEARANGSDSIKRRGSVGQDSAKSSDNGSSGGRRLSLKMPGKLSRKRTPSKSESKAPSIDDRETKQELKQEPKQETKQESKEEHKQEPKRRSSASGRPRTGSSARSKSIDEESRASSGGRSRDQASSGAPDGYPGYPGKEDDSKQGEAGLLGSTTAAVGAAGAAIGGTAAAIASKVSGRSAAEDGYKSESDEEFHDADLADIAEGDEDDEDDSSQSPAAKSKKAKSKAKAKSKSQSQSAYQKAGRRRGVSEASGTEAARSDSPEAMDKGGEGEGEEEGEEDGAAVASQPSRLKGTAGAKRRAGSTPVPNEGKDDDTSAATPQDAKAKKEVPPDVLQKAAKVAKLRADDVSADEGQMKDDLEVARGALDLFLNSRMIEAENIIKEHADSKMYYALGFGLIATMKGFMTFEPEDLAIAISYCKDSMHIAHLLRKQSNAVANLGRFVRGTGHGPSAMAQMTIVQRHAELVYAESLLLKAVLGIVYSGDFFGFVAEALNMRNAYGIYRSLGKYVETADSKASNGFDKSIDEDFRSGVFLGNGLISLILGLLPGKILKVMDVFGYSGDTTGGLETLMRAGGWKQDASQKKPGMSKEKEGIRRPVCDMGVLLFHLVISVFIPVNGVDVSFADKVLHYHLKRYPQGVFFLYFSGRLYSTQALCERAIKQYALARDAQEEYVQLKHISWWDASLCHMSLAQWPQARKCFDVLLKESNWSKSVYSYGVAANLLQSEPDSDEAADLFGKVPALMQKIAGKSIPMEKFVARKAHKFNSQRRLLLPAIEFSYIYHCLSNAPRYALLDEQLVDISDALTELNEVKDPNTYHSGADEYWDDFCLAHFLRGVTLKYIAHPEPHAKVDPKESPIPIEEAEEQAMLSFQTVIDNGHKVSVDGYLVYFAHYEKGRLHGNMGDVSEAEKELELVLSRKKLDTGCQRKGRYGMENMCLLRSNGALNTLKQQQKGGK